MSATHSPAQALAHSPPSRPELADLPVSRRMKIAGLWASMLFVYAYIDIFSLYRADTRAGLDIGEVGGFAVDDGFLVAVTAFILFPSVMVFLSLVLRPRTAKIANLVLAVAYALMTIGAAVGEPPYWIIATVVEVAMLGGIVYYAATWPEAA